MSDNDFQFDSKTALKAAHQFGASAHENHQGWSSEQREDIAYYYGLKSWTEMTSEQKTESKAAWDQGFADNAKSHEGK